MICFLPVIFLYILVPLLSFTTNVSPFLTLFIPCLIVRASGLAPTAPGIATGSSASVSESAELAATAELCCCELCFGRTSVQLTLPPTIDVMRQRPSSSSASSPTFCPVETGVDLTGESKSEFGLKGVKAGTSESSGSDASSISRCLWASRQFSTAPESTHQSKNSP